MEVQMDKLKAYIDAHQDEYLALLQKFLRQPSIAATNTGMREMADLVEETLTKMGFEVEEIPTDGYPIVWYKISIAPEADRKPRRLCLFLL